MFTSKDEEYQKYNTIEIMDYDEKQGVRCFASYANCLLDNEFNTQVKDIINVGLARYRDKYAHGKVEQTPFVLYEKYSRRDVSLLMNCGKDMSSTMYGMSRIGDDVFILLHIIRKRPKRARTTRMENLIMRMLSRII